MSEPGSEPKTKLARDAVGLADVLFQSITSMAPAAAIAASIPLGAAFAAGSLPLAVLIAFIGILFTAWSIGQLATHIPAAGSVATYTAKGLHPSVGFLVGWGYSAVEMLIVPLVMLQLGFTLGGELNTVIPAITPGWWWIFTVLGTALICWLVYLGVKTSTAAGVWLGAIEIAVFVLLALVLVVKAGSANTLAVFTPALANVKGYIGWRGVFAGAVGALLAFSGFEAAAPLAEETKNPRRNIPLAIMGATVGIGVLYIFTTYAAVVSSGPILGQVSAANFGGFGAYNNGVPWDALAKGVSIVFWALVLFAIVNSTLANANSGTNVFTRTAYALGRVGVFPKAFESLHPKYKSPQFAVLVQLVLSIAVAMGLGFLTTPVTAFGIVATALVVVVVPVYMLANLACIGFFMKHRKEERNVFLHVVIPILGFAFLVPGFMSVAGITGVPGFEFIAALTPPLSYAPWVMLGWMVLGVGVLFYVRSKDPKAIEAVADIHLEETGESAPKSAAL
jgi:amino acid transporter